MKRIDIQDELFPSCPIRNILARLCEKWSIIVLLTLDKPDRRPLRFQSLRRAIPDISQKMLSVTLKSLEDDGFVLRKAYPEVPPRVEYTLTDRARSFLPHIYDLISWAKSHQDEIIDLRRYHKSHP